MNSMRFAIIKLVRSRIGDEWEDIVFELQEAKVFSKLKKHFLNSLPNKNPRFLDAKWTEAEIMYAFEEAWRETVEEFKEVSVRVF